MSNIATNDILCVITHPAFDSQACAPNVYCMDKVDEVVIDQLVCIFVRARVRACVCVCVCVL